MDEDKGEDVGVGRMWMKMMCVKIRWDFNLHYIHFLILVYKDI